MWAMPLYRLIPATAALMGALAIAAPVAGAAADPAPTPPVATQADICASVASEGAMAVLGPYGPLGDYGPGGIHDGQANPAAGCGGAVSFALPGRFDPGAFVSSILSLGPGAPAAP
jgi:hypothetical protein